MKLIVIGLLIAIIASLGSGLFYLTRKNEDPKKLLRALQVRVALSITLLVFLVASYLLGWIPPIEP